MLFPPGFTSVPPAQAPKVSLHEALPVGFTTGVEEEGLGELATVGAAVVVASLPSVGEVETPDVELELGVVATVGRVLVLGAAVVLETFTGFVTGFTVEEAFRFGTLFKSMMVVFALSTLAKRFLSTSVKVLSLLEDVSSLT